MTRYESAMDCLDRAIEELSEAYNSESRRQLRERVLRIFAAPSEPEEDDEDDDDSDPVQEEIEEAERAVEVWEGMVLDGAGLDLLLDLEVKRNEIVGRLSAFVPVWNRLVAIGSKIREERLRAEKAAMLQPQPPAAPKAKAARNGHRKVATMGVKRNGKR